MDLLFNRINEKIKNMDIPSIKTKQHQNMLTGIVDVSWSRVRNKRFPQFVKIVFTIRG